MADRPGKRVIHFANLPIKSLIPSSFTDITEIALKTIPSLPRDYVQGILSHRYLETGDTEVLVRFAGFGSEEDEWINVCKHVRQRSLPCESTECVVVIPGDLILCFQEGKEQALYFDAHVLDAQRRRHDARGCRCRFLVRYDHDLSEVDWYWALVRSNSFSFSFLPLPPPLLFILLHFLCFWWRLDRRKSREKERLGGLFGKGERAAEVFVRFELPKPVASVDLGSEIRRKIAEATMAGRLGKRVIHFANLPIKLLIPSSFTDITEIALKTIPSASKIEIKRVLESLYGFRVAKVETLNMEGKKKKREG
ncbi:hypothetical protein Dimus_035578 [Dionaea muscipula]